MWKWEWKKSEWVSELCCCCWAEEEEEVGDEVKWKVRTSRTFYISFIKCCKSPHNPRQRPLAGCTDGCLSQDISEVSFRSVQCSPQKPHLSVSWCILHIIVYPCTHISQMTMLLTILFVFCRIGQLGGTVSLASFGQQRQLIPSLSHPSSPTLTHHLF